MTASLRSFVLALLVLVVTSACGHEPPFSPTPMPDNGLVVMLQTDANHSAAGVMVSAMSDGVAVQQVSADNTGRAVFTVPQGRYSVNVNSFGFAPASQDVSFEQPTQTVNLPLTPIDAIRITEVTLPVGVTESTIKCGQRVIVHFKWAVSKAYPVVPDGPLSAAVFLSDALSDDDIRVFDGVGGNANGFHGAVSRSLGIINCTSPVSTNYVVAKLLQVDYNTSRLTVHAIDVVTKSLIWQPGP